MTWIDSRFGNTWKENAIKYYSIETLCDIALINGRKSIILQNILDELIKEHNITISDKYKKQLKELEEIWQ